MIGVIVAEVNVSVDTASDLGIGTELRRLSGTMRPAVGSSAAIWGDAGLDILKVRIDTTVVGTIDVCHSMSGVVFR